MDFSLPGSTSTVVHTTLRLAVAPDNQVCEGGVCHRGVNASLGDGTSAVASDSSALAICSEALLWPYIF